MDVQQQIDLCSRSGTPESCRLAHHARRKGRHMNDAEGASDGVGLVSWAQIPRLPPFSPAHTQDEHWKRLLSSNAGSS